MQNSKKIYFFNIFFIFSFRVKEKSKMCSQYGRMENEQTKNAIFFRINCNCVLHFFGVKC